MPKQVPKSTVLTAFQVSLGSLDLATPLRTIPAKRTGPVVLVYLGELSKTLVAHAFRTLPVMQVILERAARLGKKDLGDNKHVNNKMLRERPIAAKPVALF